jgi:hypothetical protein
MTNKQTIAPVPAEVQEALEELGSVLPGRTAGVTSASAWTLDRVNLTYVWMGAGSD